MLLHTAKPLSLNVGGSKNQGRSIDAVVDTGFNGFLTLPSSLIQELGLVWRRRGRAMLADGRDSLFDIYEATVTWNSRPRRIAVDEQTVILLLACLYFTAVS